MTPSSFWSSDETKARALEVPGLTPLPYPHSRETPAQSAASLGVSTGQCVCLQPAWPLGSDLLGKSQPPSCPCSSCDTQVEHGQPSPTQSVVTQWKLAAASLPYSPTLTFRWPAHWLQELDPHRSWPLLRVNSHLFMGQFTRRTSPGGEGLTCV